MQTTALLLRITTLVARYYSKARYKSKQKLRSKYSGRKDGENGSYPPAEMMMNLLKNFEATSLQYLNLTEKTFAGIKNYLKLDEAF